MRSESVKMYICIVGNASSVRVGIFTEDVVYFWRKPEFGVLKCRFRIIGSGSLILGFRFVDFGVLDRWFWGSGSLVLTLWPDLTGSGLMYSGEFQGNAFI